MPESSRMDLQLFSNQSTSKQENLKINPTIFLEMVQKYKIPNKQDKNSGETIQIESALCDLANNKHNDVTTIYYLLHKKWLNNIGR